MGAGLGILSWFAFATADHGLGITTAFEHTAALGTAAVSGDALPSQEYLAGNSPTIGWEWMLVVGVFIGAALSSLLSGDRRHDVVPPTWQARFGPSRQRRVIAAFGGGAVMMIGARIAQGCTSGHGITGALQLAVSSWIFIVAAFGIAALVAHLMYGREVNHV